MYIINKKPLTANIIWDKEKGCQLCKFVNGRFETNDTELAEKLRDMRYRASLMKKRNQTKKLRSLMHRQKEESGKASDKVCLIQMRS